MRSGEDFDIIIGFLGFWAVVLLVVTVWMEVTAQPALFWALGLLAMLLALYGPCGCAGACPQGPPPGRTRNLSSLLDNSNHDQHEQRRVPATIISPELFGGTATLIEMRILPLQKTLNQASCLSGAKPLTPLRVGIHGCLPQWGRSTRPGTAEEQ